MVRRLVLLMLCAALSGPAAAQLLLRDRDYDDCLRQIAQDPAAAFDASNSWAERGGGSRARHCGALALLKML